MKEYFTGENGETIGPDVDDLTDPQRESLNACMDFFDSNAERVNYYVGRVGELGRSGADTVITLIDVDDPTGHGRLLADTLMPGHNWQEHRNKGEIPVARGLATKDGFPDLLAALGYNDAARELIGTDNLQVVLLHAGIVQIMNVQFT